MRWDERRQGCLRLGNEVLPGRFRWAFRCELTGVAEERKPHVPQCVGSIGIGLVAGGTTNIANTHNFAYDTLQSYTDRHPNYYRIRTMVRRASANS